MDPAWSASLLSVGIVSLISLTGAVVLARHEKNSGLVTILISLAVGALLGDAFIYLLPEAYEAGADAAWWILGGFLTFFLIEKGLHWRHEHVAREGKIEPYGVLNLIGDGLHNFIDGILIAASYLISFPIGLATTIAVVLHEIPQELGDYAILRSAGFSRRQALFWNFMSAVAAILGAVIVLALDVDVEIAAQKILAFTAGGFIYLVMILLKRLEEEAPVRKAFGQIVMIVVGVGLMWLIKLVG